MKAATKIIKAVAKGKCPNANCNNTDIEKNKTEDAYSGDISIYYTCANCGTEWYLDYEAYAINVFTQPDDFKLIEGD